MPDTGKEQIHMFLKKNTSDMGILGSLVRWSILLVFVIYFAVPILWLLIAPSKDATQIFQSPTPLGFGSLDRLIKSWQNITTYQNGEVFLWIGNSIRYALFSLICIFS